MHLRDLLKFIDTSLTLETMGVKEKLNSKSDLSQEQMNCMVKSIEAYEGNLLIKLVNPKETNALEQFEYCFECGM